MCQLICLSQHAVLLDDLIETGLEARARSAIAPSSRMSRSAQLKVPLASRSGRAAQPGQASTFVKDFCSRLD